MTDNTDRLLGKLISTVEALQRDSDRIQRELYQSQERRDAEMHEINTKVNTLHDYVQEAKGGKKALAALLVVAATFGGAVWEVIQRLMK